MMSLRIDFGWIVRVGTYSRSVSTRLDRRDAGGVWWLCRELRGKHQRSNHKGQTSKDGNILDLDGALQLCEVYQTRICQLG